MSVIPAPKTRVNPPSRRVRRDHRRPRPTASRSTTRPQAKPQGRRKARADHSMTIAAGIVCMMTMGLSFLVFSLLGHASLRRSQTQFQSIKDRTVFAQRDLTRLNNRMRQITTLGGLASMSEAHELYRDGRKPVEVVAKVEEESNVPQTN